MVWCKKEDEESSQQSGSFNQERYIDNPTSCITELQKCIDSNEICVFTAALNIMIGNSID